MNVGKAIATFRKRAGMSQCQLADKVGIAYQTIGYAERCRNSTRINTLILLCDGIGCKMSELITEAEQYD